MKFDWPCKGCGHSFLLVNREQIKIIDEQDFIYAHCPNCKRKYVIHIAGDEEINKIQDKLTPGY